MADYVYCQLKVLKDHLTQTLEYLKGRYPDTDIQYYGPKKSEVVIQIPDVRYGDLLEESTYLASQGIAHTTFNDPDPAADIQAVYNHYRFDSTGELVISSYYEYEMNIAPEILEQWIRSVDLHVDPLTILKEKLELYVKNHSEPGWENQSQNGKLHVLKQMVKPCA